RRNILENLEIHGLTASVQGDRSNQRIGTPLVFNYLQQTEKDLQILVTKLMQTLGKEFLNLRQLAKLRQTLQHGSSLLLFVPRTYGRRFIFESLRAALPPEKLRSAYLNLGS